MTNVATAECSFENAVDIQTVSFLANYDATRGGMTPQALQAARQELDSVRARVPEACTVEMAASASNTDLSRWHLPGWGARTGGNRKKSKFPSFCLLLTV
jgi:hypothetical protein